MTDPVLPPTTTLPCPMCNDELVEKPEPPPKVWWWWYLRWSFHNFQIAWPDSNPFPGFLPSLISYTWLETRLGFQLHLFQFRFSIFIPVLFPIWSLQLEVQGGDLSDVCRLQNLHSYDGAWEQGIIIMVIIIKILAPGKFPVGTRYNLIVIYWQSPVIQFDYNLITTIYLISQTIYSLPVVPSNSYIMSMLS